MIPVRSKIEQALKRLKKAMQLEGIFKIIRMNKAYEKPSAVKKRKKEEAARRRSKITKRTDRY